jgi:hypothetical protein
LAGQGRLIDRAFRFSDRIVAPGWLDLRERLRNAAHHYENLISGRRLQRLRPIAAYVIDVTGDRQHQREATMWVLLIYVILMIIGDIIDYFIGSGVARMWGDAISLPIFLACYFATLAIAWVIAVKIAESMKLTT